MNFLKKLLGFKNISAKQNCGNFLKISVMPINQVDEVASNLLMDINSGKFDTEPSKDQEQNGSKDQVLKHDSNETRDFEDQNNVPKDFTTNKAKTSKNQIELANQQAKVELLTFEDEFERFIIQKKKMETPKHASKIFRKRIEKDTLRKTKGNIAVKAGPSYSIKKNSSELETASEIHFISSDEDEQTPSDPVDDQKTPQIPMGPVDDQKDPHSAILKDFDDDQTPQQSQIIADDDEKASQIPIAPDEDQKDPQSEDPHDDQKAPSDDEDSSGYNSSDFEFITQSEAELDGLVINDKKEMKNKVKKCFKTVEISRIDNPGVNRRQVESMELRNRAGPSGFYPKNTRRIHDEIFYPTNRVGNESAYAFLEGNFDPLPHNNYFLEQKSLSFNTTSRMRTENGVGFDMYAYVHRKDVAPVDDITRQEAESTKEMILSMYPQERPKQRRF